MEEIVFIAKNLGHISTNESIPGEGKNIKSDKGKSRAHKIKNFSIDRLDSSKTYSIR
jgi:hypothetical protein